MGLGKGDFFRAVGSLRHSPIIDADEVAGTASAVEGWLDEAEPRRAHHLAQDWAKTGVRTGVGPNRQVRVQSEMGCF